MKQADAIAILEHTYKHGPQRGQTFSGVTGTMAAALANAATVCAVRYPLAGTRRFALTWLHLHYVCLGAFTVPVTAGRRLALRRGAGGDPSGGTDLDVVRNQSDISATNEAVVTGQISATAALTMTGVTLETAVRMRMLLAHAGASGNDYDEIWAPADPLILLPGQLAAITAGQVFDAAGTWQLSVKGGGVELP
jgi:hypothetical protein